MHSDDFAARRAAGMLRSVLAPAVAAVGVAGLATTANAQVTPLDLGLYNTGVDDSGAILALGSTDPHYTVTPEGGSTSSAMVLSAIPAPPWLAPGPDSQWIGPSSGTTQPPNAEFRYETTFDLSGYTAQQRSGMAIYGGYAVDDTVLDVQVNGASLGYSGSGFGSYRPFAISGDSSAAAGVNTLAFVTKNGAGGTTPTDNPHGFRARFQTAVLENQTTETYASESFSYNPGPLTGNNGGTGFAGGWGHLQDFASATVTTLGLDDIGSVNGINSTGNKVTTGLDSTSSQSFRALDLSAIPEELKDADGNIGSPGTSVWFSVLAEREGDQPTGFFGFGTFLLDDPSLVGTGAFDPSAAGINEQIFVGVGTDDTQWKIQGNGSAERTGITPDDASTPGADLLVVRIDFLDDGVDDEDRLRDAAYLWVNPDEDGLGTPNINDADGVIFGGNLGNNTFENLHFNAIRIAGAGIGNIDEFRLGSNYQSVVVIPEPASLGLIGAAGLLALRRRRR